MSARATLQIPPAPAAGPTAGPEEDEAAGDPSEKSMFAKVTEKLPAVPEPCSSLWGGPCQVRADERDPAQHKNYPATS